MKSISNIRQSHLFLYFLKILKFFGRLFCSHRFILLFLFFISIVFSLVYFRTICVFSYTPSIIFNFYLDNGVKRNRNVDKFMALTFITKYFILVYLMHRINYKEKVAGCDKGKEQT